RGVAMHQVGPRDATRVPLSTSTASSPLVLCAPNRGRRGDQHRSTNTTRNLYKHFYCQNRERVAWGAGDGNERACSPARCRRNPDTISLRPIPQTRRRPWIASYLGPDARWDSASRDGSAKRLLFEVQSIIIISSDHI